MTTERRESNRPSPLELRLYIVALLAAVYTVTWRAVGGLAHAPASSVSERPPPTSTEPERYVWLDRVPLDARPVIALPAGWQLAQPSATTQPARVVRVPDRRVPRVRTRSS